MKAVVFHGVGDIRVDHKIEPLTNVIEAYKAFDERQPGWMKVELEPALIA